MARPPRAKSSPRAASNRVADVRHAPSTAEMRMNSRPNASGHQPGPGGLCTPGADPNRIIDVRDGATRTLFIFFLIRSGFWWPGPS